MRREHVKRVTMSVSPRRARTIAVCIAMFMLAGCSWFESDTETRVPVKLLSIDREVALVKRWTVNIGGELKD